jgi:uncharacterized protein (TIGR02466 family)
MQLMPIYSTPLWQSEFPDFEKHKDNFISIVRKFREENPINDPRSNVGGYQSPKTLHQVEELNPLFEHICQMGYQAADDLEFVDCDLAIPGAWLNINDSRQCMNSEHIHSDTFSGVVYLKAPEGSGKLCLTNPGLNPMWDGTELTKQKNQFTAGSIKIVPEEGDIILFPSYLPHSVETNDHDDERISISFNLILLPKETMQSILK